MAMTRDEVISVLGPVGHDTITEIVSTGASLVELEEAWAWIYGDEALMAQGRPLPGIRIAKLIDLLEPEEDESSIAGLPNP